MHKVLIIACCAVSISFSSAILFNVSEKLNQHPNIPLNMNRTLIKAVIEKISPKRLNRLDENQTHEFTINHGKNTTDAKYKKIEKSDKNFHPNKNSKDKVQKTFPILHKIHERITRSKDAVWATITLTFMCVLLVLAVAQSRMWKDNYYSEAQGVPLPNFNERVLFKDVMEHKISSLKKFFKKKSKENATELESLLPPSEWDS